MGIFVVARSRPPGLRKSGEPLFLARLCGGVGGGLRFETRTPGRAGAHPYRAGCAESKPGSPFTELRQLLQKI
jgi:hypothetical protein